MIDQGRVRDPGGVDPDPTLKKKQDPYPTLENNQIRIRNPAEMS